MIELQKKLNENSVLAQIKADEAVVKIMEDTIPEVVLEIADTLQKDLADGKFDKVNWADLGSRIWDKAKPQIVGGANDYLKTSSFEDGRTVAAWVVKRFFAKKQLETKP
jgi:hypothetical protein